MKRNDFVKRLTRVGSFLATTLLCVSAIAFVWQGAFLQNTAAMANPGVNLLAADLGNQVKGKANEGFEGAKDFIQDTKERLKKTANKNADKVDQATNNGSYVERKANRDAARIEQRADDHAAKTEKAVDKTQNVVESTIDKIKDAFSN